MNKTIKKQVTFNGFIETKNLGDAGGIRTTVPYGGEWIAIKVTYEYDVPVPMKTVTKEVYISTICADRMGKRSLYSDEQRNTLGVSSMPERNRNTKATLTYEVPEVEEKEVEEDAPSKEKISCLQEYIKAQKEEIENLKFIRAEQAKIIRNQRVTMRAYDIGVVL